MDVRSQQPLWLQLVSDSFLSVFGIDTLSFRAVAQYNPIGHVND